MATLNGHPVTRRYNRPSSMDSVLLELYNAKGGSLSDPYAVRSVHIFPDITNGDSSYWLVQDPLSEEYGQVDEEKAHTQATMIFSPSGFLYQIPGTPGFENKENPNASGFGTFNYDDQVAGSASGIFKLSEGHLGVVLESNTPIAGAWITAENEVGEDEIIQNPEWPGENFTNATDAVGKYFDIWTVQAGTGNRITTFIHSFEMTDGNNMSFTEPLLITTQHSLVQKYVNNNSKVNLQINSEHTINNTNLDESIKNMLKASIITRAAIRIVRLADSPSESVPFVIVKDFADTLLDLGIDSDDTISYLWDTTESSAEPGTYHIQVESEVFDQVIRSDPFTLILR